MVAAFVWVCCTASYPVAARPVCLLLPIWPTTKKNQANTCKRRGAASLPDSLASNRQPGNQKLLFFVLVATSDHISPYTKWGASPRFKEPIRVHNKL
jgi:hypothetical protein